jgi:hypothetical protein
MDLMNFYFGCSREYIDSTSPILYAELAGIVKGLPKRGTQSEINNDFYWLLTEKGWSYDTLSGTSEIPPKELSIPTADRKAIEKRNDRLLCMTSSTLDATWHCDFANTFSGKLVQIEVQFGKVESMFKDFCGFRIARYERRLALGIEIVMREPAKYFAHRKASISGMAYFEIAHRTLPAIGLDCPIWLIGLSE